MDNNTIWLEQSLLLAPDLKRDPQAILLIRKLGCEFRRAKQPAILNTVKRLMGQEVQGADPSKIHLVIPENFSFQITKIYPYGISSQFNQDPAEPRLEFGCVVLARSPEGHIAKGGIDANGSRRFAGVRAAGDIQDPLALDV